MMTLMIRVKMLMWMISLFGQLDVDADDDADDEGDYVDDVEVDDNQPVWPT
jgi:hypothetical protein